MGRVTAPVTTPAGSSSSPSERPPLLALSHRQCDPSSSGASFGRAASSARCRTMSRSMSANTALNSGSSPDRGETAGRMSRWSRHARATTLPASLLRLARSAAPTPSTLSPRKAHGSADIRSSRRPGPPEARKQLAHEPLRWRRAYQLPARSASPDALQLHRRQDRWRPLSNAQHPTFVGTDARRGALRRRRSVPCSSRPGVAAAEDPGSRSCLIRRNCAAYEQDRPASRSTARVVAPRSARPDCHERLRSSSSGHRARIVREPVRPHVTYRQCRPAP